VNFAITAALCHEVRCEYRRLGERPAVLSANLRWLAGYRHERVRDRGVASRTQDFFQHCAGASLNGLAAEGGETVLVLPTIFHMMWRRELVTDVSQRILSLGTHV
jgi:hypothetical protein